MRPLIVSIVAFISISNAVCFSQTTQPSQQDLLNRLDALQAEVSQLKAELKARGPQTQPSAPTQVSNPTLTTEQMLEDVDRHTKMLDWTDTVAGFVKSKGFYIRSEDGNFLLHPWSFIACCTIRHA